MRVTKVARGQGNHHAGPGLPVNVTKHDRIRMVEMSRALHAAASHLTLGVPGAEITERYMVWASSSRTQFSCWTPVARL